MRTNKPADQSNQYSVRDVVFAFGTGLWSGGERRAKRKRTSREEKGRLQGGRRGRDSPAVAALSHCLRRRGESAGVFRVLTNGSGFFFFFNGIGECWSCWERGKAVVVVVVSSSRGARGLSSRPKTQGALRVIGGGRLPVRSDGEKWRRTMLESNGKLRRLHPVEPLHFAGASKGVGDLDPCKQLVLKRMNQLSQEFPSHIL